MNIKPDAPKSPIVFENVAVSNQARDDFILGTVLMVLGLSPLAIGIIWPDSSDGEVIKTLVGLGLGFYLSAIYRKVTWHKRKHERIALILDQNGIGGSNLFESADERLNWPRIKSLEIDGAAVVIRFEPKDLSSDAAQDRRSLARLSLADRQVEEIATAIRKFCHHSD